MTKDSPQFDTTGGLHHVYVNDIGLARLKKGGSAPYPDGTVFAATGQDGKSQLWIRLLNSATAQRLQGTDSGIFPFWSPDGLWVGFFADGKLKKIDRRGGSPIALADVIVPTRSQEVRPWHSLSRLTAPRRR